MRPKIISAADVVKLIPDNATVCFGGGGAGHAVPDKIMAALGENFQQTRRPRHLTLLHPRGIGDNDRRGLNHLAHEGLVKRAIGGFWGNAPKMTYLAQRNLIEGYNFPQGVLSHLVRATAGRRPGVITTTGLHTFVDPRLEGGKLNSRTTEELVQVIEINGQEYLLYQAIPIDVAIIRGTTADKNGNLTMEEEVGFFSMISEAQAARCNGGIVIAQVKQIDSRSCARPGDVKIPAVLIDYVVEAPDQEMTFLSPFEPALIEREAPFQADEFALDSLKQVIARRAALELFPEAFVNIGYGIADGVPIVAQQTGIINQINFLIEQGALGGIPTTGLNFGAMYQPAAILDDGYQFDFFHGGGLDLAFLGFAQIDQQGNVNSSRFGNQITGCGGFIDISQNAKKVVFCGSFTVKSEVEIKNDQLVILNQGKINKFIEQVQQVTFSGNYARQKGQEILYVTERAVFRLVSVGLLLVEIAPGIDLEQDVLSKMDFRPLVSPSLKLMSPGLFATHFSEIKSHFVGKRYDQSKGE